MAALRLIISTTLVFFLVVQSRPLRDKDYEVSIDIDGVLHDYVATEDAHMVTTTEDNHPETSGHVGRRFNVLDYGAVGDGHTDSSNAFLRAWDDICGASGQATLVIPAGKVFMMSPVSFSGPCKSSKLQIELLGTIIAPGSVKAWRGDNSNWIQFSYVSNLTIQGGGTIDGQGSIWWNYCKEDGSCERPTALRFHSCNNLVLNALHHVNSQRNHISINGCNNVEISHMKITAPENSPNTDGIDISSSSHLHIRDSFISTGDDCIAINGGTSNVNVNRVTCGPGHGISIGSLGKNGGYETVEDVHVTNCTFKDTTCSARIKTWQGGRGYVRRVSFEHIRLVNAGNPIMIEQAYGQTSEGKHMMSGNHVEISDVTYKGIVGSSSDERAVYFNCAGGSGCKDIHMENVEITHAVVGKKVFAECYNAHGRADNFGTCLKS
ncbi:Probable polygalacturonase At3g15720 [Linum grandiflorum]